MRRLVCMLLGGHAWRVLIENPHRIALRPNDETAGRWMVCDRCRREVNDLWA